jgi:uncharacterized protein YbbC (DUF1343 family)
VQVGLERLVTDARDLIVGRRVGLLCHPASVDPGLRHAADLVAAVPGVRLVRLLGPEHGVRGFAQDMIAVGSHRDPRTGAEVASLYGSSRESLRPTAAMLADLDVLVCDLQDVGSRYYTYVWTVVMCLEAAEAAGLPVVVCDRPNPLDGVTVEGGRIAPGFESFVGYHSVPNRHGMTLGELVRLVAAERGLRAPLHVVECVGWDRRLRFEATGLPWVMPSPNMPTLDTALVYPGQCLVEGTELSEGRGTTRPFELVGAPWVEPDAWADALHALALPGARFRPLWFQPQFQKHAGQPCGGLQLHVVEPDVFRPYLTSVALLATARRLWPDAFRWRRRAYEFVEDCPAIDLLTGSAAVRLAIDRGASLPDLAALWEREAERFLARRAPHLLY